MEFGIWILDLRDISAKIAELAYLTQVCCLVNRRHMQTAVSSAI